MKEYIKNNKIKVLILIAIILPAILYGAFSYQSLTNSKTTEAQAVEHKSNNKTTQTKTNDKKEKTKNNDQTPKESDKNKRKKVKLTKDEVINKVTNGSFGNGTERKLNVEKHGYEYKEIQSIINERHKKEMAKKAKKQTTNAQKQKQDKKNPSKQENNTNNNKESTNKESTNKESTNNEKQKYKANHIYVAGTSMPTQVTSYDNLQQTIDSTTYTWISFESFNPNDNKGTYFAQHRHTGGELVLGLANGSEIILTDSEGNPYSYIVSKILHNQEHYTEEIGGELNKEYIVLQTSEHRINGNRVGNRIVIADKK